MPNIRTVANEADVSIATVSRVLNNSPVVSEQVRSRVLGVATRLGYGPTQRPTNQFIALAYTGQASLASPYDVAVLDGMAKAAEETGFDLAIVRLRTDRRPHETWPQLFQRKGVRGAVLRTTSDSRRLCMELADQDAPFIVVGDRFEDQPRVNYLDCDSRATSFQAIEHLISLGHRRIAIAISHVPDNDHNQRVAGYEASLKAHGIEVDPKLILHVWAMRPLGAQVIRNLMSMPDRPTAIFICDPLVAVGAINQAHEMGVRIPQEISIIGFDDSDARGGVYPKMSAVCQDARLLGYEAAMLLTQSILREPGRRIQKVMPSWLELHQTTAQPPTQRFRVLPDGSRILDEEPRPQ